MNYFYVRASSNINEIGRFPQCETSKLPGNLDEYEADGWIGETIISPIPILHENAKLTSYLNLGVVANPTRFMAIDKSFLELIEELVSVKYERWAIQILHKGNLIENYSIIHFLSSEEDFVEYDLSEFFIGKLDDWNFRGNNISIKNKEDYLSMNSNLRSIGKLIKPEKIVLNFTNATDPIIRLDNIPIGKGYYFSESFVASIRAVGLTGMQFNDIKAAGKGKLIEIHSS